MIAAWWWMLKMPGRDPAGSLPPLSVGETELAAQLRRDVQAIAGGIGERNIPDHPRQLEEAAAFIEGSFKTAGYAARSRSYRVATYTCRNIEAEHRGAVRPEEIVVIGAHYDTVPGSPGADDNASGVAILLALARRLVASSTGRTVRFVAFANEEPPWFWQPQMGSLVYARECKVHGNRITAMVSLESLGYYLDSPGSQSYPAHLGFLFPDRGNFVAFVGNIRSRWLVRRMIRSFRAAEVLPAIGAAVPELIPGVGWSDHWAFWQQGYAGIEITDTALYRNPYYHTPADTPDCLDYSRMARLTVGLSRAVLDLAN